jgi:hypothetical protein
MFELYLYSDTIDSATGLPLYELTVALDLSLKRNSSGTAQRDDYCITLGIANESTKNAAAIYLLVKVFMKEQLETYKRKLFVVWDAAETYIPGIPIDDVFLQFESDIKVTRVPNNAAATIPEPAYAHYKKFLGPSGQIRRMRIAKIRF